MNIEQINEENKQEIVDIHPLKKGKRILVFLADLFVQFIISFVLFNIAVAPIGKAITHFNDKNNQHIEYTGELYEHYYKSGVLLTDNTFEQYDVTAGLEYTYRCFLSYYVLDTEESIDPSHPQYGHKNSNEVALHFYNDIRDNKAAYFDLFKFYAETDNYFDSDEVTKTFTLKAAYKNELYSFFDPKDEMGKTGQGYYDNLLNNVYSPLMAEVMKDIETNDLSFEGEKHTFLECKRAIESIEKYYERLMTLCAYIAHFVSWIGYFLIFPLVNGSRKTLAMVVMKIERVNFFTLNHCSRKAYVLNAFYWLFSSMMGILFLPSILTPFNTLFTFRFLIYGSVFSTALAIANLIFLLINQYNRSLIDFLSNNLFLTESEMDELYRARGYNI